MAAPQLRERTSGILLHLTSLPSRYGIGDLGPEAYEFVDFLARAGQGIWQVLPLNQTAASRRWSPYDCISAFAGNTALISCEMLAKQELLRKSEIKPSQSFQPKADFARAMSFKNRLFGLAYERFKKRLPNSDYLRFCRENEYWLEDYATFAALRNHFGLPWTRWPARFKNAGSNATVGTNRFRVNVEREKFLQFIFFTQWLRLKKYCNQRGIKIIGDIPIYVAYDSSDVWANRNIFKLNKAGTPLSIAGVPPDLFSKTGQLWGNPVYDWNRLAKNDYRWWTERIKHNLRLFDVLRIDHFRGFVAYWEVPAKAKTARRGKWSPGPKYHLFDSLLKDLPSATIIAEDLGYITPDVTRFVKELALPSMKVLLFAFDGDASNPYLPHNHTQNCIVYTGTHDNNTVRGWFEKDASNRQKQYLFKYIGRKVSAAQVHREFVRMAMASVAKTAVMPMQDLLGLDAQARMNHPARKRGNWLWRLKPGKLTKKLADRLRDMTETYGRT